MIDLKYHLLGLRFHKLHVIKANLIGILTHLPAFLSLDLVIIIIIIFSHKEVVWQVPEANDRVPWVASL